MYTIYKPNQTPAELIGGTTSTTEKVFQDASGNAVLLALDNALLGPDTSTGPQFRLIRVTAAGRCTGGTTTNFTPQLQFGISTTVASNTDIESGAAVAVDSNAGTWMIQATLMLRVTGSGTARIDGWSYQCLAGSTRTFTAIAVTDNSITTYNPTLTTAQQGFVVTGTFSSGNASNAAYLDLFNMEILR